MIDNLVIEELNKMKSMMGLSSNAIITEETTVDPKKNQDAKIYVPQGYNKIISCIDGREMIVLGDPEEQYKHRTLTYQEYYNLEKTKKDKSQDNLISACQRYSTIQIYFKLKGKNSTKKQKDDLYNSLVYQCIQACFLNYNLKVPGCSLQFLTQGDILSYTTGIESGRGRIEPVYFVNRNWFLDPEGQPLYDSWYKMYKENPNLNLTEPEIKAPWEFQDPSNGKYVFRYKDTYVDVDIKKMNTEGDAFNKKSESEKLKSGQVRGKSYDPMTFLPFSDEEVEGMKNMNLNPDGTVATFKKENDGSITKIQTDDQPWCLRNGVTYANLRNSPTVDYDLGFGPLDEGNYRKWTSNRIVGVPTGKRKLVWLPLYEYQKSNETGQKVYTRFENENVKNFLNRVSEYAKSDKRANKLTRFTNNIALDVTDKEEKKRMEGGFVGVEYTPEKDLAFRYIEPYLEDTDLRTQDILSGIWHGINSLGTKSGYKRQVIPQNTIINDPQIMSWALTTGAAKYWIELLPVSKEHMDFDYIEGAGYMENNPMWVSQSLIEPCKIGGVTYKDEQKKYQNWDDEYKKMSHNDDRGMKTSTAYKSIFISKMKERNDIKNIKDEQEQQEKIEELWVSFCKGGNILPDVDAYPIAISTKKYGVLFPELSKTNPSNITVTYSQIQKASDNIYTKYGSPPPDGSKGEQLLDLHDLLLDEFFRFLRRKNRKLADDLEGGMFSFGGEKRNCVDDVNENTNYFTESFKTLPLRQMTVNIK